MPRSVSVIIPALNEAAHIAEAIDSAFAAGASEVIVADGGSSDATVAIAGERGAVVVEGERRRGRQLNAGAAVATGDALLFLHADTLLPAGAAAAVSEALREATFGGFRIAFRERSLRLAFVAFMVNLRTRITGCPWGDQAQFIRHAVFDEGGGFRDLPLMEDYELAVRMSRRGPTRLLALPVLTSGRRFLRRGVVRTTLTNWLIVSAWRFGVDPDTLARWYRGEPGDRR